MAFTSPLIAYLQTLSQNLPKDGLKADNGAGSSNLQAPALSQMGSGAASNGSDGNSLGQAIEGGIGGLLGGSGASGGQNSLMQGIGFASSPSGTMGPFQNSNMATTALNALKGFFA